MFTDRGQAGSAVVYPPTSSALKMSPQLYFESVEGSAQFKELYSRGHVPYESHYIYSQLSLCGQSPAHSSFVPYWVR